MLHFIYSWTVLKYGNLSEAPASYPDHCVATESEETQSSGWDPVTVPLTAAGYVAIYITSTRDWEKCTTWMLWISLSVSVNLCFFSRWQLCSPSAPVVTFGPSYPVTRPLSLSHLQLLWKARSPHRQTVALTHYTVKSSITRFLFCFSSTHPCVSNSVIINIVQNVTKKNVHLVFWVFFYTRQAEADYYVYRRSSPSSPPPPPHLLSHPQHPLLPLGVISSALACDPSAVGTSQTNADWL